MTLTLNLSPELEQYLVQEADQHGLSVEMLALQLLTNSIAIEKKQAEAVDMLQSWIDEDDIDDQQETGQYLIRRATVVALKQVIGSGMAFCTERMAITTVFAVSGAGTNVKKPPAIADGPASPTLAGAAGI